MKRVLKLSKYLDKLYLLRKERMVPEERDGDFCDRFGACKVCDGEIPYGHTDKCYIWKVEAERNALREKLDSLEKITIDQPSSSPHELVNGLHSLIELHGDVVIESYMRNNQPYNDTLRDLLTGLLKSTGHE